MRLYATHSKMSGGFVSAVSISANHHGNDLDEYVTTMLTDG